MSEQVEEQLHKTDNIKLVVFLLSRGCLLKGSTLRSDNRVDFVVTGDNTTELVREHRMGSSNTLVPVHVYDAKTEFVRDTITSIKKEAAPRK